MAYNCDGFGCGHQPCICMTPTFVPGQKVTWNRDRPEPLGGPWFRSMINNYFVPHAGDIVTVTEVLDIALADQRNAGHHQRVKLAEWDWPISAIWIVPIRDMFTLDGI